jgi:ABC-type molybdate transport system, periplasmic component
MRPHRSLLALILLAAACSASGSDSRGAKSAQGDTVVVFDAASLAAPVKAALDSFSRRTGAVPLEEHGASLELARRITELGRVPDVIALADHELFTAQLGAPHTSWYLPFARNRMVVAYTDRSRYANEITSAPWYEVLLRPGVRVGRADPELAPAGYRALIMYALAESHYTQPGLAVRLAARTPPGSIRGNATELAALLATGELDYVVDYESLARSHHFRFVSLPSEIDLGDAALAAEYARASVRVRRGTDSVSIVGSPILYGASVPSHASHPEAGARFLAFLVGDEGRAIMRAANVDMLIAPEPVGDSVPAVVRQALHP